MYQFLKTLKLNERLKITKKKRKRKKATRRIHSYLMITEKKDIAY